MIEWVLVEKSVVYLCEVNEHAFFLARSLF